MKLPDTAYKSTPCPTCGRKCVRHGKRICSGCESRTRKGASCNAPYWDNHQPVVGIGDRKISDNEQIVFLRSANRELETRISGLLKVVGEQRELADSIKSAIVATEPFPRPTRKPVEKAGSPVVPVIKLSDWHIGEIIQKNETEDFGEYSWRIAQSRLFGILDSFVKWVYTLRNGYRIDECIVLGEGDYISGDIHRELSVTNEFPVPVQTAKAGLLFGEAVAFLAAHFGRVTVYQVGADNHGRLERKPQFKQKFQNSYSFLVHTISEAYLLGHKNVEIFASEGMKYVATIAGWKFLIEHGDTVKSWMGIPYYGIERARAREATRRMGTDRNFHYQSIGHWHVPGLVSGNILINGSLSGTSEFDHGCGRHAPPSQVAFLVSQKHGVFNVTAFHGE